MVVARRVSFIFVSLALMVLVRSKPAGAHGIGGRADLPVPLSYFVIGASVILILSFVALTFLWKEPRLQDGPRHRNIGGRWVTAVRYALGALGLAGFFLIVADAVMNRRQSTLHISPVVVWVYFWLVIPFLSALVGDIWKWISPWRTIALAAGTARKRRPVPTQLGMWPAVIAFVSFTWFELVSPQSADRRTLGAALLLYTVYVLGAARWFGIRNGLSAFDAFENYNNVLSRISPLGWTSPSHAEKQEDPTTFGLEYRGWLRALPVLPIRAGLTAFVVSMIGTVTYDGLSGTAWWGEVFGTNSREVWFGTLALIATVMIIGFAYLAASAVAARIGGAGHSMLSVAGSFAHTLVPIALAYAVAHYFTLVLYEGQLVVHAASDPFGMGWDLIGTATWRVEFFLPPEAVWWVQVAAIIVGHVAGIVLAHDRALWLFGNEGSDTQYAMLMLMVILTSLGLFVLAG